MLDFGTGTYIDLDIWIWEGKDETFVDIFGCVIALRGRGYLVQNVVLTSEPDTLPATAFPNVFTNEKIASQYQYDATIFKYSLRMSVDMQKTEGKSGSEIRYSIYRHWARELKRHEIGTAETCNPHYEYPKEACDFLRKLTGGPAKREKKQVKVVVTMTELCKALAVPERR